MKHLRPLLLAALLAVVSSPLTAASSSWPSKLYKQIERRTVAPRFPKRSFVVTDFGASPSASPAANQQAINQAIKACSEAGGGVVIVPEGQWQTGALRLLSHVNLRVEKGATLLFAFQPELYPLVQTRWEGLDLMNYSPCIYAFEATDVAITGQGTIDGGGTRETWWPWCGAAKYGFDPAVTKESQAMPYKVSPSVASRLAEALPQGSLDQQLSNRNMLLAMSDAGVPVTDRPFGMGHGMRPQLIQFYACQGVLLEDVTLLRSPFWVVHPVLSRRVIVRRCTIINDGPNGDGCDPESCEDVIIENCTFRTGDDCIAIKSGRNADGRRAARPSRGIIIRGCTMQDGHGGVVIGSEISGGVQNVFAHDCQMDSPNLDRVLRIKTNTCRGAVTEGIYMRHIRVGQCREAVLRINLVYEPNERSQRGFVPTVRSVYMDDVTCQKSKYGVLLNGLEEESRIYDIHLTNCRFDGVTDQPVRRTGKQHDVFFDHLVINGNVIE